WGWRGLVAYAIGFACMVPFFSTPKFTGPIAKALDGADLSLFVGLPVAAGLYLCFARSIDVAAERRIAEREAEELEELAAEHAMPTASVWRHPARRGVRGQRRPP